MEWDRAPISDAEWDRFLVVPRPEGEIYQIGDTGLKSALSRKERAWIWAREIMETREIGGFAPCAVSELALQAADLGYLDAKALVERAFPPKRDFATTVFDDIQDRA